MGRPILIIGASGSGKSASLRNFEEVALIKVIRKDLPFRPAKPMKFVVSDDVEIIKSILLKAQAKSIVIDDAGYIMTNHFMKSHSKPQKGGSVFDLYNKIGDEFWDLIEFSKTLPDDKIIYFLMHEDRNENFGTVKPKTIGKMLDNVVVVEGLFTVVLRAQVLDGEHVFKTHTDGFDVVKTPIDMFEKDVISNDLKIVDNIIRKYYHIENVKKNKEATLNEKN